MDDDYSPKIKCKKCKLEKTDESFGTRDRVRKSWCKECCAASVRRTYAASIDYRQSHRDCQVRRALENHRFLLQYLLEHPCVKCGEKDPLALEFDHIKRDEKKYSITGMSLNSRDNITKELNKCQVLCGTCHRRKTAMESNSIRFKLLKELKENN
jgi:5-methylcytosine-specific restriction endonuclease McrA